MEATRLFTCALLLTVMVVVRAHDTYRNLIPNGFSVPNSCGSGIWQAVGHFDPIHHTHDKNPFGLDFSRNGHTWTVGLCQMDSDGDGITNGEELGDPNCVWTTGATPSAAATGHPGICEPVRSGPCASVPFYCGCHGHNCIG